MKRSRSSLLAAAFASFTLLQWPQVAVAQKFPSKPIDWIVAFGAGGGADRTARSMFPAGEKYMGVRVDVKNIPGAGGVVAWRQMLAKPADGYTLVQGTSTPVLSLLLEAKPVMQPDQIKIVCYLSSYPAVVAAHRGDVWSTWDGLVKYAKANPGKLSLGATNSSLVGAVNVLTAAGLKVALVPYNSTSDALADFIGGHINMIAAEPPAIIDLVKQGNVAVFDAGSEQLPKRVDDALGNPPLASRDLHLKSFSFPRWIGVHPDTDEAKVKILSDRIGKVLKDPAVVAQLKKQNLDIGFVSHEEAQTKYDEMVKSMRQAVKLLK